MTNDWLCVSLNLSVPATFHVSVDHVTNTSTKTVYSVKNIVSETVATDMLTVFEVQVNSMQNRFSQLVVVVTEGAIVRNVDIQNAQCNVTSKYVTQYLQTISSTTISLQKYTIMRYITLQAQWRIYFICRCYEYNLITLTVVTSVKVYNNTNNTTKRGGKKHNLTSCIKKRISDFLPASVYHLPETAKPAKRKSSSVSLLLAQAVAAKVRGRQPEGSNQASGLRRGTSCSLGRRPGETDRKICRPHSMSTHFRRRSRTLN